MARSFLSARIARARLAAAFAFAVGQEAKFLAIAAQPNTRAPFGPDTRPWKFNVALENAVLTIVVGTVGVAMHLCVHLAGSVLVRLHLAGSVLGE